MENRSQREINTYDGQELTLLQGKVVVAADGTVSSTSIRGVTSASRTAEGNYTLTLDDAYAGGMLTGMVNVTGTFVGDVKTDNSTASSPTIVIETESLSSGAVADADSQTIYVSLMMQRRSA